MSGPLASQLARLALLIARRLGPAAAAALIAATRAWLSDPDNETQRARLVSMLRTLSRQAGGQAGEAAQRMAGQIESRRRNLRTWRRELAALRDEVADHSAGPVRAAAFDAYLRHIDVGPALVAAARNPTDVRRRVMVALTREAAALSGTPFGPHERDEAIRAIEAARAGCYEGPSPN
ncbi:MAG: hypothetical protein H6531_03760 [Actinobacteria bacterium]|nr:hypothetical protein [Actinomycetota bacterium]